MTDTNIKAAFQTLANVAGGVIDNGVFKAIELSKMTKTSLEHDMKKFYCLAVPGKAFFIRSNGKISVTGNTLHCESMIRLFREFVKENRDIWTDDLKSQIYGIAEKMVELENNFIDLSYGVNEMNGLKKEELKLYIKYISDRRLISLGMKGIFKVKRNPLPWVDGMLGTTHTNFFEQRVVDYAKGAMTGSWSDVWASHK